MPLYFVDPVKQVIGLSHSGWRGTAQGIAEKTIARKTGARGLRSIMEDTLKNLMFEVPSDYTIEKITVTKDSVENGAAPEIVHNPDRVPVKIKMTQPKRRARKDSAS